MGIGVLSPIARQRPAGWVECVSYEKGKRRLRQWGSLPFITGSGFGRSRVPQYPGMGQKERPDRNILGPGQNRREGRK
jgi:hypothetical protein